MLRTAVHPKSETDDLLASVQDYLSEKTQRGVLLCFDWTLKDELGSSQATTGLALALRRSIVREIPFVYCERTVRTYALARPRLDFDAIAAAIKCLHRSRLVPYLSRVQDILSSVFNLQVSGTAVLSLYAQHVQVPPKLEHPFGHKEPVLSLQNLLSGCASARPKVMKTVSKLLGRKRLPTGMYVRALYYKLEACTKTTLHEVYLAIEAVSNGKYANESVCTREELVELVGLIEEQREQLTQHQAEELLNAMVFPRIIDWEELDDSVQTTFFHKPKEPEATECPVCFDELLDHVEELECLHKFHRSCVDDVVSTDSRNQVTPSCPICRREIHRRPSYFNSPAKEKKSPAKGMPRLARPTAKLVQSQQQWTKPRTHRGSTQDWTLPKVAKPATRHQGPARTRRTAMTARTALSWSDIRCSECSFHNLSGTNEKFLLCELCSTLLCTGCRCAARVCRCITA